MLPMDRPLGEPAAVQVETIRPDEAATDLEDVGLEGLFDTFFVNTAALEAKIRELLRSRVQVSLEEVLAHYPLSQGLAEVVTYMDIASKSQKHYINDQVRFAVQLGDAHGLAVQVPQVIYTL